MKKKLMTGILCCLAAGIFVGCGKKDPDSSSSDRNEGAKDTNRVVIFSSAEEYRNEVLSDLLKKKFPELEIVVQYYPTGKNASKIMAEGTQTEADLVLGLETGYFQKIADNFADIHTYNHGDYLPDVDGIDDRFLTWERFEGALIVNTDVLAEKGLPEPKSDEDLLKPEYEGLIVMPNPKTSSTGYMFLNNWVNLYGKEEAFAYVDKLQSNIKQFTESGSGPVKMLVQGEAAIGIGMIFQAADQITKGAPLKIIAPETGIAYNITSYGIISGREENPNVMKVFEYLNQDFIYYDKENYSPGKIFKDQEIKMADYPSDLQVGNMSTINDSELQTELLNEWKY